VLYIALDTAVIDQPSRLVSQPWDASEPPQTILRLPANTLLATVGPPHSYAVLVRKFPFVAGDIWLVPLDTPSAARPFVATKADEGPARISPDGRLLAYVSDETGRSEIYVRPVPGPGGRVQVSADGGGEPAWGGDGKELYYRGANHVMRANLSTGAALGVRRLDTLFSDTFEHRDVTNFDVFPDGKKLLMIQGTRNVPHVGIIFNFPELLRRRAAVR
jgi:serine/threonine-protein kinase